jgi:hypothetical protein
MRLAEVEYSVRIGKINLNHTPHNLHSRALLAIPALLLFLLGGALFLSAQGSDTPIVISDGSLTIDATVPWTNFQDADATTKSHPHTTKSVTKVVVTAGGATQTFNFSSQKCTVAVRYAATDIVVSTDDSGKALRMKTDYGSFRPGARSSLLAHTNPNAKISSVTVTRGAQTVFTATPSGGTKISISYQ